MFDNLFINYCAPTLMGLKVGSMFSYQYDCYEKLRSRIIYWNRLLNSKGIFITLLKHKKNKVIVYAYNKEHLSLIISNKNVSSFLHTYGYNNDSVGDCINLLKRRFIINKSCPHEIGVFLGYPLEDVKSFIKYNGKNSLYTGYWKVYHNKKSSIEKFRSYDRCREILIEKFLEYQNKQNSLLVSQSS